MTDEAISKDKITTPFGLEMLNPEYVMLNLIQHLIKSGLRDPETSTG